MHIKNKRGQSTVEYILLVTAVVAILIVFLTNQSGGLQKQLNSTLTDVTDTIGNESDILINSHSLSPSSAGSGQAPYLVSVCPPGATGPGC